VIVARRGPGDIVRATIRAGLSVAGKVPSAVDRQILRRGLARVYSGGRNFSFESAPDV
jgi:hypothetical protein